MLWNLLYQNNNEEINALIDNKIFDLNQRVNRIKDILIRE